MADHMTIQAVLRLRAEFLKANAAILVDMDLARSDGGMMYNAALYIERLERDKSRLVEEYASMTRSYNKADSARLVAIAERDAAQTELAREVQTRLDHAHDLTDQEHEFKRMYSAVVVERDSYRAERDKLADALSCERLRNAAKPRFYVESHVGRLDRTTRRTWNVRDRTQPISHVYGGHRAVAHVDTLEMANSICKMLNAEDES